MKLVFKSLNDGAVVATGQYGEWAYLERPVVLKSGEKYEVTCDLYPCEEVADVPLIVE